MATNTYPLSLTDRIADECLARHDAYLAAGVSTTQANIWWDEDWRNISARLLLEQQAAQI